MDKYARWLTDKYICIMLLIFPLWTGTVGYTGITRPKFLFFALLTGFWLAALLACALFFRCKPSRPRGFQLAALAFMAAACLSALFSENIQYSILGSNRCDGLVTLLLYGGIALGVSRWGEFKERYVNLSALAAGLCAVVCILQLCRVNVLGLFPEGLDFYDAGTRYTGEFLGTMGNTNVLAAWFCLVIPLLTVSALRSRPVRAALLLLVAAACLGLLFYIEALSGLVGCLGCALVTAPYYVNQTGRRRAARILLAAEAAAAGEVPVGCVIVRDGEIVGRGRNRREEDADALGHAEIMAIRQANETLGGWRLHRATMYVTLEPCPMCAGGIINARIGTVRYGAKDDKAGACGSVLNLFEERFNHRPRLYRGPMEAECGRALRAFFEDLREKDGFSEEI